MVHHRLEMGGIRFERNDIEFVHYQLDQYENFERNLLEMDQQRIMSFQNIAQDKLARVLAKKERLERDLERDLAESQYLLAKKELLEKEITEWKAYIVNRVKESSERRLGYLLWETLITFA